MPTIGAYGASILTSTILLEFVLLSSVNPSKLLVTCTTCSAIGYFFMALHWHTTPHAYNYNYYQPKRISLLIWLFLLLIILLIELNFIRTIAIILTNFSLLLGFNL